MTGSKEKDIVILVADLSGYTALTEAHGNASAAKIINRYSDIARKSLHADTRVLERVGDEILFASTDATSIVRTALRLVNEIDAIKFRAIGEVNFKNIFEPIALFKIITDCRKLEVNIEDPVCRMIVNPNSAAAQLAFKGKQYYFCSFECAQKFAARPDRFAIN